MTGCKILFGMVKFSVGIPSVFFVTTNEAKNKTLPHKPAPHREAKAHARTLWLGGQECRLDAESGHFVVRAGESRPVRIPALAVRQIIVEKHVSVSAAAITLALESAVPMNFFGRHGDFRGSLRPCLPPRVEERVAQYRAMADDRTRLALARRVLQGKLESCHRVLGALQEREGAARTALLALEQAHRSIASARRLEELRGMEGAAARRYFEAFGAAVAGRFEFPGRTRQPPADPVNALLSYGYSVLVRDLAGKLELLGLDPYVGFLHEPGYGSPALALDLAEPLRAGVIDMLVLRLLENGELGQDDFQREEQSVLLGRTGKQAFFAAYEKRVCSRSLSHCANPHGSLLQEAAESFRSHLAGGRLGAWRALSESCRSHLS